MRHGPALSASPSLLARCLPASAAALLGLVVASTAVAATAPLARPVPTLQLSGPVHWTAVSGRTGQFSKTVGGNGDIRAAKHIKWWESSDEPCQFQVGLAAVDGNEPPRNVDDEFCGGSPGSPKVVWRPAAGEFVTAVAVCLTDKADTSKDKLKGLRLWGRIVDASTGELGAENGPAENTRSHCAQWSPKVSCPAGEIATKIKVYYNRQSGSATTNEHGFARGISLGCRAVELD